MAQLPDSRFCSADRVMADGSVPLTCSADAQAWPWLALDPHHPIVVQTVNFWASVEAALQRKAWDKGAWTALTEMEWQSGAPGCGHAAHGIAENFERDGKAYFRLTLFDAAGQLVYRMSGTGVVFRTRDFEGWRQQAKQSVNPAAAEGFAFAGEAAVGAPVPGGAFLSPLDGTAARGLIAADNGLPPAHPYMSGSGDHVNATHLAEAARQFFALQSGQPERLPTGGTMRFKHYVELGSPFEVKAGPEAVDGSVSLTVHQSGRLCTEVSSFYD